MSLADDFLNALTGTVFDFAGSSQPAGFLWCNGAAVSRATYARLFAVIGTTYGAGDGSTTFNVPDLRGRVVAGKDNMGGSAASRMTSAGGGVDGATLGGTGGTETHTLTAAQIPAHNHGLPMGGAASGAGASANIFQGPGPASGTNTSNNTGGGGAHPITQPTFILNKIIKNVNPSRPTRHLRGGFFYWQRKSHKRNAAAQASTIAIIEIL